MKLSASALGKPGQATEGSGSLRGVALSRSSHSLISVSRLPVATVVAMISMIRAKTSLCILWQVSRLPFLTLRE